MTAIFSSVFLVLAWVGVFKLIGALKHREEDEDDDFEPGYFLGFLLAGGVILLAMIVLFDAVRHLVNPNYYAVRAIIKTFIPQW